jgi:hypothetical protein
MQESQTTRLCKCCNEPFKGRTDKQFCSNECRNQFHNKELAEKEIDVKRINSILRKNRSILRNLSPTGKTTVRREYLEMQGFDMNYFTHVYLTKANNIYRFCYEWGYILVGTEKVLIVNWQDYMNTALPYSVSTLFKPVIE